MCCHAPPLFARCLWRVEQDHPGKRQVLVLKLVPILMQKIAPGGGGGEEGRAETKWTPGMYYPLG